MSEDSEKEQMENNNVEKHISYSIQEQEKNIKFYLINDDIYYIFIKNKNEIKILPSTELSCSFTLYHHELIQDFIITSKTSSLILCSLKDISIYVLPSSNKKLSYNLSKQISIDNTLYLSSSILEDIIISINSHFVVNIFDLKLKNLKSFTIDKSFISKDNYLILPLDVFMLNYDTKTILLSKYGYNQFGLIYKEINNEDNIEYKIKNILINEKIICIKEYEKNIDIYFHNKDNSVLLILTEGLNFLIVQKVFEENFFKNKNIDIDLDNNYNYNFVPNIRTLLYIDLSEYNKIKDYHYLSFSFFLDSEKKYYNNYNDDEFFIKNLKSEIINPDSYNNINIEDNNNYFDYGSNIKDINYDYLMFNFSENIYIYKIEGLKLSNYNNPSLTEEYLVNVDSNYRNTFTLLNTIKSLDNNYSIFFIDKYNILKKYNLKIIKNFKNDNNILSINHNKTKNINIDFIKNNNNTNNKKDINNQSNSSNQINKVSKKFITINNKPKSHSKNKSEKDSTSINSINSNDLELSNELNENPKSLFKDIPFDNKNKSVKKDIFIEYSLMFPLYKNIIYSEYNNYNQLTLLYNKIESNSIIYFLNNDFSVEKMIIFEDIEISKIIWIKNTNFIMFYFIKKNGLNNKDVPILVIFNIFSKYLNKKENVVNENKIKNLFIYENINMHFKLNIKINNIYIESNLESLKIDNNNSSNNDKNKNIINNDNNKDNYNIILKQNSKSSNNSSQLNNLDISFSFYILLKTDFSLYNLIIKIIKTNKQKEYESEIKTNFIIKIKSLLLTKYDMLNLPKKDFIFNSNEIFYTSYNEQYDFISIIKINKNLVNKKIFESILLDKLSNIYFYNNNFIIYINKIYINIYDIKNRSFYRILNEYIINDSEKILFFSYDFHLYLIILTSKYIQLINLISSNENANENIIKYEYKYNFLLGEFNMINLINNSLFVNDSQIIYNLNDIIINKDYNYIQLIKILSINSCSIYDKRSFLDNYLNDDENINKFIFNILYNNYQKSKTDKTINYAFKNIKTIPNIFENIEIIKKIISEEGYNFETNIVNNLNNIKFDKEKDSSKIAQFQNFFNKIQELSFINYLYELISNEKTKKYDNITKYYMLKYKSIINNGDNIHNFKLSSSDLCWLSLINNQTDILNFIFQNNNSNITWDTISKYNIPLWIKSESKLKELLLEVAKNKYKEDLLNKYKNNTDKTEMNNYTENIALYLYLSGNNTLLYNYYDKEPHNEKIKKFIMRDFSIKKNRKAAHENADTLLNKKKYIYAAFFYLLADDMRSALDMTYEKMKDINLTVCLLKLVKKNENDFLEYYSLNKIYTELFINFGILFRDPYLVTFGYIGQEKYDLALEYILEYNYEYNLNKIKETINNIDEFVSNLDLLKKTFYFSVFDYKMILFAKKLEKIYNIKYEESSKTIKNLVNTDFNEDEWDMDALNDKDEEDTDENRNMEQKNNNNIIQTQDGYKIKKINIDYNNLALLCLKNCSIIGNIFSSNINFFTKLKKKGIKNIPLLIKHNIKNVIKSRIILDTMYITALFNISKINKTYSSELNIFLEYLIQQGIINNKHEIYYKITDTFLIFNLYKSLNILPINIYNGKQKNKIFKSIQNYFDLHVNKIIWDIIPYHKYKLNSLSYVEDLLYKYNNIFAYLVRIVKDNKNNENIFNKIYLLRIIICNVFFLIFVYKGLLKYNKINELFEMISKLNEEYDDIIQIKNEKIIYLIEVLNKIIIKFIKKIKMIKSKEKVVEIELMFYMYFMNYSINKQLLYFLQNQNIKKISSIKFNTNQDINYITIDNYNFINDIELKIEYNLNGFDFYINKYITKKLDCSLSYGIYEELKNIYINKKNISYIKDEVNNYKIIKIEKLFHSKEKNKFFQKFLKFEKIFKLGENIKNYLPFLTYNFKYEKNKEHNSNNKDNQINIADNLLPPSSISSKSIQIVNNIFGNGYDICNYNNELKVNDFCINSCDITQMSISLLDKGNIKINVLDKIIGKLENKKEEEKEIELDNITHWENAYKVSMHKDFKYLIEFKLIKNNFDNIYPILYKNIVMPKYQNKYNDMISHFPEKLSLPPNYFNNVQSQHFLDEISLFSPKIKNNSIYSDILEPHPQLPLYLSSNNNGEIYLYSFNDKKILDKYNINLKKTENNVNLNINKIKFNKYGDNFMACDTDGNLYYWTFDHMQSKKIPYYKIKSNINTNIDSNTNSNKKNFFCNDMCYLNNTGVIATISNKNIAIYDLLMPKKNRIINEIYIGGDIILPLFSEKSLIVGNGDSPGGISFVDLRKMEVIKNYQLYINNDIKSNVKIMDMKLSENENYLVSYGSDYTVKIWDLSDKYDPLLIESLQPFNNFDNKEKNNEIFKGKIKLSSGYLFVSKDNNIKMLRNNII